MNLYLLLALCSLGVAALCFVAGWLAEQANRRWPDANQYRGEKEQ